MSNDATTSTDDLRFCYQQNPILKWLLGSGDWPMLRLVFVIMPLWCGAADGLCFRQ